MVIWVDVVRFLVGVLTGAVLAVPLLLKVQAYGFRVSPHLRDRMRDELAKADGWPVVFCRECGSFVSTAPGDARDDDDDDQEEQCLGKLPCFVRDVYFYEGEQLGFAERSGPLCPACDARLSEEGCGG